MAWKKRERKSLTIRMDKSLFGWIEGKSETDECSMNFVVIEAMKREKEREEKKAQQAGN